MPGLITTAKPVPQLYGDPYSKVDENQPAHPCSGCGQTHDPNPKRHRGSCLSACLEVVAAYQSSKSKGATLPVKHKAYPNDPDTYYFWNQATIHHFVWADKRRLLELVTDEPRSGPGDWGKNTGLGWIAVTVSRSGSMPTWVMPGVAHLEENGPDDYLAYVKKALECGRLPIVSVSGMCFDDPRRNDWIPLDDRWEPPSSVFAHYDDPSWEGPSRAQEDRGRAPISLPMHRNTREGHALVISGWCIPNQNTPNDIYVRILDPDPSMRLRQDPRRLYIPDPVALNPLNHVRWAPWEVLEPFIRDTMGLMMFRSNNRDWGTEELGEVDIRVCVLEEPDARRAKTSFTW